MVWETVNSIMQNLKAMKQPDFYYLNLLLFVSVSRIEQWNEKTYILPNIDKVVESQKKEEKYFRKNASNNAGLPLMHIPSEISTHLQFAWKYEELLVCEQVLVYRKFLVTSTG